jgi:hypothetical protein
MYLDGVKEGIVDSNVVQRHVGRPLFCLPQKLALTVEQAEDIMMRQAQKMTDPDGSPIALILTLGLMDTLSLRGEALARSCAKMALGKACFLCGDVGMMSAIPPGQRDVERRLGDALAEVRDR